MSKRIYNIDYLLKIVKIAQYLEGYWSIDSSEWNNGSVHIAPGYLRNGEPCEYYKKRVYDYKECYIEVIEYFEEDLEGYNEK